MKRVQLLFKRLQTTDLNGHSKVSKYLILFLIFKIVLFNKYLESALLCDKSVVGMVFTTVNSTLINTDSALRPITVLALVLVVFFKKLKSDINSVHSRVTF